MAILTTVYIESKDYINTDATDSQTVGVVDTYSVWRELDYSLPMFPPQYFMKPSTDVGISSNGLYSWRVIVPTAEQKEFMKIKQFPAIFFFDVSQNRYLGRLDGVPKYRGDAYRYLKNLGLKPFPSNNSKKVKAGLGLAALLLFLIKKPKLGNEK